MSTEVEISVTADIGGPEKPIQQETAVEGDSGQFKIACPPYNIVENNNTASDSGVSNASSLTSDSTAPLNNGDIHELPKIVSIESTSIDIPATKRVEALRSRSAPSNQTNLRTCRSYEAVNMDGQSSSLLEVSETEHGLSIMSLEVLTSGDQLNLIGDVMEDIEGSVGTASRSLSPDMEEGGEKERVGEQEEEGAMGTPSSAETGTHWTELGLIVKYIHKHCTGKESMHVKFL